MIKEDFPYLERTHLLQLMGQTVSKTAIYHMKSLLNTRWRQHVFHK